MDIFDQVESIQEQIAASQNKIAEYSYSRDQAGIIPEQDRTKRHSSVNASYFDPKVQNQIRTHYQDLINQEQNNIAALKQSIKDLSARDEERSLERFKTALNEENAKFQEEFNKAAQAREEQLAARERLAYNSEKIERVVEIEKPRSDNDDFKKFAAMALIGAVILG